MAFCLYYQEKPGIPAALYGIYMQRIAQVCNAISYGRMSKMNACDIIGTQTRRQAGRPTSLRKPRIGPQN